MAKPKQVRLEEHSAFYGMLGTTKMLSVFLQLLRTGETHVTALSDASGMQLTNASVALRMAAARGFLESRREGNRVLYSIAPAWREAVAEVAARVGT